MATRFSSYGTSYRIYKKSDIKRREYPPDFPDLRLHQNYVYIPSKFALKELTDYIHSGGKKCVQPLL